MRVLCSLDTDMGTMATLSDDKHIEHDNFAMSSYFMQDFQEGEPSQYGYFSYSKDMGGGVTSCTTGQCKIGDSKSYKQTSGGYDLAKAVAKLLKTSNAYDIVAEVIKASRKA